MSVSRNNCLIEDDRKNSGGNRSEGSQINASIISVVKPVLYFIGIFKSRINLRNGTTIKTNNESVFSGKELHFEGEREEKEKKKF